MPQLVQAQVDVMQSMASQDLAVITPHYCNLGPCKKNKCKVQSPDNDVAWLQRLALVAAELTEERAECTRQDDVWKGHLRTTKRT